MSMQGDGASQPGDSGDPLSDLVDAMIPKDEEAAPEEAESEDSAESEESETEESAEGEEEAEEPTFTIKHDGKDVILKQSELIELSQQGFDYSKKTMAVAEERKAAEAERSKATEVRVKNEEVLTDSIGKLEAFEKYMLDQIGSPPPIEWAAQDAAYYLAQKEIYEQRKGQLQQAQAGIEHLRSEQQRQRQAHLQTKAAETVKALRDTLPSWNEKTLPELETYVHALGLNPDSAGDGYLHQALWQLAHKAKAYDAIQASKAQMKPKQQLTKVAKPQAANPSGKAAERIQRDAAFHKSPSVDALADFLRSR